MTMIYDTDVLRARRLRAALENLPADQPRETRADESAPRPRSGTRRSATGRSWPVSDNDDDLFDNVPI